MQRNTLTLQQVQRLALQSQGLLPNSTFGKGKQGVVKALQSISYVQIDTISVVERAHHHVLLTRLPDYQKNNLLDLQANEKKVFEYWSHAAAYLPMEDFRFCLPRMNRYASGKQHWTRPETQVKDYVFNRIKAEGSLMSKDFKKPEDFTAQAWNWKPAKRALEQLFMEGKLMITARKGFQKVYDLTERALPDWVNTKMPSTEEFADYLILRAIEAHGLVKYEQIPYLRSGETKKWVKKRLPILLEEGKVEAVKIGGLEGQAYYTTPQQLKELNQKTAPSQVHILSPFDNIVIQRKRLKELFGFEYTIECYVTAAKRVYGYFSLLILWGTRFIARMDAKADRKQKVFYVRNLVFEEGFNDLEAVLSTFTAKLWWFAKYHQCQEIVVEKLAPIVYREVIVKGIEQFG